MNARRGQTVVMVIPILAFIAVFRIFMTIPEAADHRISPSQDAIRVEIAASDAITVGNSNPPERTELPKSPKNSLDERFRELIVGTWKRYSHGNRLLTIRKDGTATMVIKPDFVWAFVFGNRVDIEIKWKIENGRAIYHVTSGTPPDKAELARQQFGDRWNEKILELDDDHLLLLDGDDKQSQYKWKRVVSEAS